MWSKIIGRGKTLRMTDLEGKANVGMLLYNAYEKHERYNMPDTLKGQHIFTCSLHIVYIRRWDACSVPLPATPLAGTIRYAAAPMKRW